MKKIITLFAMISMIFSSSTVLGSFNMYDHNEGFKSSIYDKYYPVIESAISILDGEYNGTEIYKKYYKMISSLSSRLYLDSVECFMNVDSYSFKGLYSVYEAHIDKCLIGRGWSENEGYKGNI